MNIESRTTQVWKRRMWMLMALVLGTGGWFFYDGFIGWPAEMKRHGEYQKYVEGLIERGEITRELADTPHNKALEEGWRGEARRRGWSTGVPAARTGKDFRFQKILGAAAFAVALVIFGWYVISNRRVLRCDGNTIECPDGTRATFDEVTGVNRKRWNSKGIAVLLCGDGRKLVLDDYKYGGAEEILLEAERRLAARNVPAESIPVPHS